jgi:hypothetical protein
MSKETTTGSGSDSQGRESSAPHRVSYWTDSRTRRFLAWLSILGAISIGILFLSHAAVVVLDKELRHALLWQHAPVLMGLPLASIAALSIVLLLSRVVDSPLELEGLGLKFKGAAGPVVLWILCFGAIVAGIHVLWTLPPLR